MKKIFTLISIFCILISTSLAQEIIVGVERIEELNKYKNKRIGVLVNQTSYIKNTHLVDYLIENNFQLVKIFAPEHGFKGKADAGEYVNNDFYGTEKIPIISLYGSNKKPTKEQLSSVDVLFFDIQDVGARFYTYISSMHYAMEACAENNLEFVVLDRPNPLGMYVDGPVLDLKFQSFVGMHPIPIVHGLTIGELAQMINGEKWLTNGIQSQLTVIPCKNYTHSTPYSLPIKPSPNLPNDLSIWLYPSLCLFEGTPISVGRGTMLPFQQIGYPNFKKTSHTFTPKSIDGMSKNPPFENKVCNGYLLNQNSIQSAFSISYLIEFYNSYSNKGAFFNASFFDKLAGNSTLREQIISNTSENDIRESWQMEIEKYKFMRKKYLLYSDFE